MKKHTLNFLKSGMLLLLLLWTSMYSYGQRLATSILINRTDSTQVSGDFINYPAGSGHYIHYAINHDTTAKTVNIQISSPDSVHFGFYVLDTALNYVLALGGVNNSTFNTTINVGTLNSYSYLQFEFSADFYYVPTSMFYTTFK